MSARFFIAQAHGGAAPARIYLIDTVGLWQVTSSGAGTLLKAGTWTAVASPFGTPSVLYLGALEGSGQFWRSLDSGATWTDLTGFLPSTGGLLQRLAVADGDGSTLYIGDDDFPTIYSVATVHESTDFGATWAAIETASDDHNSDLSDLDYKDGPLLWQGQMAIGSIYQNPFTTDALPGGSQRYGIVNKLRGSDYVVYGPSPDTFSDEAGLLPTEPSTSSVAYVTRRKVTDDSDKVGFTIPSMIAGLAALPLTRTHGSQAVLVTATTLITMFATTTFIWDGSVYVATDVQVDVFLETVGGSPVHTLSLSEAVPTSLGAVDARLSHLLYQDPLNPLVCWAYIHAGTLYQTLDGGATWSPVALAGPAGAERFIIVAG